MQKIKKILEKFWKFTLLKKKKKKIDEDIINYIIKSNNLYYYKIKKMTLFVYNCIYIYFFLWLFYFLVKPFELPLCMKWAI